MADNSNTWGARDWVLIIASLATAIVSIISAWKGSSDRAEVVAKVDQQAQVAAEVGQKAEAAVVVAKESAAATSEKLDTLQTKVEESHVETVNAIKDVAESMK